MDILDKIVSEVNTLERKLGATPVLEKMVEMVVDGLDM